MPEGRTDGDAWPPAAEENVAPDPASTLAEDGEIDVDALAEEFGLPARLLTPLVKGEQLELLLLPLTEPQLAASAEAWQCIVQEQTQDVVDATLRVNEATGETADRFQKKVADLAEARRHMFDNFIIVLNNWQKKGGNAEDIANFCSGLMIMTNKPFDMGDYVDLEGLASGTVKQTSLISTIIATVDNKIISIKNNRVWNSVITNVSASSTRRVDMVFGISYSDNIEHAISLLKELVGALPLVLKSPEPVICVEELADSSVNILCRPWSANEDYWTLYWDIQQLVKERFDSEGISIPFPQRSVHLANVVSEAIVGAQS